MAGTDERVEDRLEELRTAYPNAPVEQTTVPVDPAVHERVAAAAERGVVEATVTVERDTGETLHVADDGDWTLPTVEVPDDADVGEWVGDVVHERTGVEPALDGLASVTITGYRCEDESGVDTLYRLTASFVGSPLRGSPDEDAAWR